MSRVGIQAERIVTVIANGILTSAPMRRAKVTPTGVAIPAISPDNLPDRLEANVHPFPARQAGKRTFIACSGARIPKGEGRYSVHKSGRF